MKFVIKSQYKAALTMLRDAIDKCEDILWYSDDYQHQFWWLAYHVLFYADYYMCESANHFQPWKKHVEAFEGWHSLDPRTLKAARMPVGHKPYTRVEMLAYCDQVMANIDARIEQVDLESSSGFERFPFNRLELYFYNIRHIQHHTGQLAERVRQNLDRGVTWVGWDEKAY